MTPLKAHSRSHPYPRPAGNHHIRNLVQMNLTSNGVMRSLRAPTCGTSLPSARHYARPDSFLASATRALPLPDRPNMCRPPISAASSRALRLSASLKPTSPWKLLWEARPVCQSGKPAVAPSAIKINEPDIHTSTGKQPSEVPRALETSEVPRVVEDYRRAAERSKEAVLRISRIYKDAVHP